MTIRPLARRENLKPEPRTHALFLFRLTTLSSETPSPPPSASRHRRCHIYIYIYIRHATIRNEYKRNSQRVPRFVLLLFFVFYFLTNDDDQIGVLHRNFFRFNGLFFSYPFSIANIIPQRDAFVSPYLIVVDIQKRRTDET